MPAMSDRDDAPPGEAVAKLHEALPIGRNTCEGALHLLRDDMSSAARWRLIGWLAQGLEPTRGMVEAGLRADPMAEDVQTSFVAMLAAARAEGEAP